MVSILGLMTCFNRKDKTVQAIDNLVSGNTEVQFDFIVADDASSDGTAQVLQKYSNIQVINGTGNLFYSGGMRAAIESALRQKKEYDFCLLFNDDVQFFSHAIDKMIKLKKQTIWVGPTCDYAQKTSYGGVRKKSSIRPSFEILKADNQDGLVCDTFNANCVLIPWSIFRELGNIDPVYSHSLGDFDYGFEAKRKGFDIRVTNEYVGICCDNPVKGGWRDTTLSLKRRLHLKESPKGLPHKEWFHYLQKNYSLFTAIVYSIIPYLRILLRR